VREGSVYEKILLAYDGSREGRAALLECADIAPLLHAETHLLAVTPVPAGLFLTEGFIPEQLVESEQQRTKEILAEGTRLLTERGAQAKGHLASGEPVEEICRMAKELGADLIVVGHAQHASFASRWWKGSVGATLMEHAPCSILVAVCCDR
jgi:nucleotide-binding universal stress UspA family protein